VVQTAVSEYSVRKENGAAIVTLTAGESGIFNTDALQWAKLVPDINALTPDFVVLVLDSNPHGFSQVKEFELLHKALTAFSKSDIPVFVVSSAGTETVLVLKEGVRYIDFAAGTGSIRFWGEGKEVMWGDY
jgi:hypothetical protein